MNKKSVYKRIENSKKNENKTKAANRTSRALANLTFLCALLAAIFLVQTSAARAATYTVTNANDVGAGSLRRAIENANATTADDVVVFDASFSGAARTITLTGYLLIGDPIQFNIPNSGSLNIVGPGADRLTISGNNSTRVFIVNVEHTGFISGVKITNGYANGDIINGGAGNGGAILNVGNLQLNNSIVANSSALENGGGIFTGGSADLTVSNSTVSGNSARLGGGIANSGKLTVNQSTISNNTASAGSGGGIYGSGSANLISATVCHNAARDSGGGIYRDNTRIIINLYNTIIADNTAPVAPDIDRSSQSFGYNSQGYNLIENVGGALITGDETGNIYGQDPKLGALQDNGGTTPTRALLAGSPAIDKGRNFFNSAADQRGFPRPVDDPSVPNGTGGAMDIGAFESQSRTLTVDNNGDNAALSACQPEIANDCSLRGALGNANGNAADETIAFASYLAYSTITLTNGQLVIADNGNLTIDGLGANRLTVSGSYQSRVFFINPSAAITVSGLQITGGSGAGAQNSGLGGGIYVSSQASLTLNDSIVKSNAASNIGGGVYNDTALLTLNNSTVSNNSANSIGGIYNKSGIVTLNNTTVSDNSTNNYAGGIGNDIGGIVNLNSSTVSNNSAVIGGGVSNTSGSLFIARNSIIADNTAVTGAPDFFGALNSQGYNLIENTSGTTISGTTTGNILGQNPLLGALQENGGTTPNRALLAGSPAIDKGSGSGTDQRGFARPYDNAVIPNAAGGNGADIGAFEVQAVPTAAGVTIGGRVTTTAGRGLTNAFVFLTDANGASRSVRTTTFGYFHFDDIAAGQTVVITVVSKQYTFSPQVMSVSESVSGINFAADK